MSDIQMIEDSEIVMVGDVVQIKSITIGGYPTEPSTRSFEAPEEMSVGSDGLWYGKSGVVWGLDYETGFRVLFT